MSEAEAPARPGRNLDYPFERRPEPGETVLVAPGVHWVRMRLPMQLNHINLWLLEDGDGWTIVDTGIRDRPTMDAWEMLFAGTMAGRPVKRVIVTHLHPDHVGLAGWLTHRFDVALWMTRTDFLLCRNLVADTGQQAPDEGVHFFKGAGFDEEMLQRYRERFGGFGLGVHKLPNSYRRIQEGEEIEIGGRVWRVVIGRGHAPEHACLWCESENVLISGDQLLPRISSNVSVFPTEPEADPLRDWLESCARLKTLLPEDVLVLPSHNEPFRGAHKRLQELIDDHEINLARLKTLCEESKRAIDCFPALFRSRITSGNTIMATGESIAHLNCLIARGEMTKHTDTDGVVWYKANSE
ncbi:MAG TPA: MBL fold metallo-hydrolase [Rhizomicrobium sp.]|nr:MBL fold metallo-hydrolase [Rhizomicrobium sp.]